MKTKKVLYTLKIYSVIAIGALISSLSINLFLEPNNIVSGGASGVAIIALRLFQIPMGITMLLINIPLFLIGARCLGMGFGVRSIFGTLLFSVFTDVFSFLAPLTQNILMAAIFGGVFFGIGFSAIFLVGATTGGTDILAAVGNKAMPVIDVGKWIFAIDIVIILSGALLFKNTELVLSGILALFISTFLVDYIISGANGAKIAFIVSDKSNEISEKIIKTLSRGVTGFYTCGMYIKKDRLTLMCVVKRFEIVRLMRIVKETDPKAFVIFSQARQVTGEGFKIYPIQK